MREKFIGIFILLISFCALPLMAQEESTDPGFLTDFTSFTGLAIIIVPALIGFINDKLSKPMKKWVTYTITFLLAVGVSYFSWYFELGFPPADASWYIVLIDGLFIGLAATGLVSVAISDWLAKLISDKFNKDKNTESK